MGLGLLASLGGGPSAALARESDWFVESAADLGVDFVHFNGMSGRFYNVEVFGPGGALFDADGDGDLDLYLVQGAMLGADRDYDDALIPWTGERPPRDRLFRNELSSAGPRFVDVTEGSGIVATGYGLGAAAGDVDNDGDVDLYVLNFGPNQLWLNRGDGTFAEATAAGVDDPSFSVSASFSDYDLDGDLDLFVVDYVDFSYLTHKTCLSARGEEDYCLPTAFRPVPDRLYRNRGDGTFEDVSAESGIGLVAANGLGVVSHDFDGDGRPDFYVANDLMPNQLWLNSETGGFVDEGLLSGAALNGAGRAEASMGVALGDVDGDRDLDIFLTHFTRETNTLMRASSAGPAAPVVFDDATEPLALGAVSWDFTSFGTGFLDYDNDGWLDLVVVSGAVTFPSGVDRSTGPYPMDQPNQLLRNLAGRSFEDVTALAGAAFELSEVSRGALLGDLDNDGDTDIVVTNNSGPTRVLINTIGSRNGWLGARPLLGSSRGSGSRPAVRDAHGAVVSLRASDGSPSDRALVRRAHSDGGYATSNDPRVLFGLGDSAPVSVDLEVRWPDGASEHFGGLSPGRYHTLLRGDGEPIATQPKGRAGGSP